MIGISIRAGGFAYYKNDPGLCKDGMMDGKLCVESPLDVLDDVGVGAFMYGKVKQCFRLAHDLLKSRAFLSESFLKLLINYQLFHNFQEE